MIDAEVIKDYHPFVLKGKLDDMSITDPDSAESPGGLFLTSVASHYVESRKRFFGLANEGELHDAVSEVAGYCIPDNENDRWRIVADLCLYNAAVDAGGPYTWENATDMITMAVDETARNLLLALVKEDEAAVFEGAMGEEEE